MAHDHDHNVADDDLGYEDIDIKDALGLPDVLPPIRLLPLPELARGKENIKKRAALGPPAPPPPIRLLPLPELAAQARTAPVARQLAALAEWVGKDGREVEEAGDPTSEGLAEATAALGVDADELAFLWECALSVEWLVFDDDDESRVSPGETADD